MKVLKIYFQNIGKKIILSPLYVRRSILFLIDALIILSSLLLSNNLLFSESFIYFPTKEKVIRFIIISFIGVTIYFFLGQYKRLSSYFISATFYDICKRNFFLVLFLLIFQIYPFGIENSLSFWFIFWMLTSFATTALRFIIRDWINLLKSRKNETKKNVAIYGAGSAGMQLFASINDSKDYSVKFFIDDNKSLHRRLIGDIKINPFNYLENNKNNIDLILLAMPSLNKKRLSEIILKIQNLNLQTLKVPSLEKLNAGDYQISRLQPISIDDLIGREKVTPNQRLLSKNISKQVVCVIGAGGSIGSELCRQIIRLNPKKLILFERNEMSLYKINQIIDSELNELEINLEVKSFLACATDRSILEKIFRENKVDTVFNTAAYKHVPIVEDNLITGLSNNIISTKKICEACLRSRVKKMVYISSDKAVRPTNVMGASKRVSELIVKSFAKKSNNINTIFSMVRFGNVLGSSGSVVPLFNSQIDKGGPITITHPEVTRYFMTIEEAAQLVIQASALSKGGEIFLLNMGDPIKIKDLAYQMVKLKGLSIRDDMNENGEIKIIYTGMRPGEKLYEELILDGVSLSTKHPLIFKSGEKFHDNNLLNSLESLINFLNKYDTKKVVKILKELVPEWNSEKYLI